MKTKLVYKRNTTASTEGTKGRHLRKVVGMDNNYRDKED